MNGFERVKLSRQQTGKASMNKKTIIIPAQYKSLFPDGRCNILQGDKMVAFQNDPDGDLRLHTTTAKDCSTMQIISSPATRFIRSHLGIGENKIRFNTWQDSGAVIISVENADNCAS